MEKKNESILRLLFNTPTDEQANIVALLQPLLKGISDSHCYVTDFEFSLLLQAFQRIPAANRDSFLKSMSFFLDRDLFWFPLLATNLFDDSAGDLSALHKAIEPILEDVVPLKRDAVFALQG